MLIRRLEIENFRGVRSLDWRHIPDSAALIGPGDSGKSTILEAIERLLTPRWNVVFDDADFWAMNCEEQITIRATIVDLPNEFYRESRFGLVLNGFDVLNCRACEPTGADDEIHSLVVELRVDSSLEPHWCVVDSLNERTPLSARDREVFGMLRIGGQVDQHLGWSRGSALSRITDDGSGVSSVLAQAARQARAGIRSENLTRLSDTSTRVQSVAKRLGVATSGPLTPRLDASALSLSAGALSLHEGDVPARRAGLGTRRLLTLAMQREASSVSRFTLIDEFETGLEPHRIRRLLRALRGKGHETHDLSVGQLFITSHSPSVIAELDADEVTIVRRAEDGHVDINCLPSSVDYVVKRDPQALLAPKVIVAEGVTEVGLCYALDDAWMDDGESFGYLGVAVVNGAGGTQPAETAGHLAKLGYAVALLVDSDATAKTSKARGATIIEWSGGVCTEERLSLDLPLEAVKKMATWAFHESNGRGVRDALAAALNVHRDTLSADAPEDWPMAVEEKAFRQAFGRTAKSKGWFKSAEGGYFLGSMISSHWHEIERSATGQCVSALKHFSRA